MPKYGGLKIICQNIENKHAKILKINMPKYGGLKIICQNIENKYAKIWRIENNMPKY